ncbi:hypothetical protein V8F33_004156 [Rhypophila sp. PSN 637]
MSYTPNDASQWTTGSDDQAGYTVPTTMGYDLSYLPATTGSWNTTGMEMTHSSAFPDPMYSYMGTSENTGAYDSSYQYASAGSFTDDQNQYMYQYDQEGEAQEASEEESASKKGKKRAPRKYTSEQMAKRREQNRKAQRVYRDRKDQRIKELEEQLAAASQQTEVISSAIEALRAEHAALTGGSSSVTGYPAHGGYPPATRI